MSHLEDKKKAGSLESSVNGPRTPKILFLEPIWGRAKVRAFSKRRGLRLILDRHSPELAGNFLVFRKMCLLRACLRKLDEFAIGLDGTLHTNHPVSICHLATSCLADAATSPISTGIFCLDDREGDATLPYSFSAAWFLCSA